MTPHDPSQQRLGTILRNLRVQRGFSIRTFATMVGFSPSFISQVEADGVSPSIHSLEKIAAALGVSLSAIFSALEHRQTVRMIIRRAERTTFTSAWSQTTLAILSDPAPDRILAAVELTITPGGMTSRQPEPYNYDLLVVIQQGSATLRLTQAEFQLEPGDSVYLGKGQAFAWTNRTTEPCNLLLVSPGGDSGTILHQLHTDPR